MNPAFNSSSSTQHYVLYVIKYGWMNTELSLDKIPCVCVYLSETKCMKRRKSTYVTCTFEWTLFVLSIVSLNHFIVNELCRTDLLVVTRFSQFKPYEASVKPVKSQKKNKSNHLCNSIFIFHSRSNIYTLLHLTKK